MGIGRRGHQRDDPGDGRHLCGHPVGQQDVFRPQLTRGVGSLNVRPGNELERPCRPTLGVARVAPGPPGRRADGHALVLEPFAALLGERVLLVRGKVPGRDVRVCVDAALHHVEESHDFFARVGVITDQLDAVLVEWRVAPGRQNHRSEHRLLVGRVESDAVELLDRHTEEGLKLLQGEIEMELVPPRILEVHHVWVKPFLRDDSELDKRREAPALERLIGKADPPLPRRPRLLIVGPSRYRNERRCHQQEKDRPTHNHHTSRPQNEP